MWTWNNLIYLRLYTNIYINTNIKIIRELIKKIQNKN